MNSGPPSPLGGPPPNEIPLAKSPLERVIAQVRFTPIAKMDEKSFVAGFQEDLRAEYPFFEEEYEQFIQLDVAAGAQTVSQRKRPVWRFLDAEKNWRISLTSDSIALEVKKYTSRADFLARWSKVLGATAKHFTPALVVRIGMRYVDRLRDQNVSIVSQLIKSEYLGPLLTTFQDQVRHMISETTLSVEEGNLLLRLGKLPSGGTIDPNVLEPISSESFIVDIDVSSVTQRNFDCQELENIFRQFAERAYAMFRDMVTNEFDKAYGGQP
ncbi:MAG: TIGR04255 family protein [Blastocatellia bacterium]